MAAFDLYTPLEEAVAELHRRRGDEALCRAVENFQRVCPPAFLHQEPSAILARCVFSADFEFRRFLELCERSKLRPLCLESVKERFTQVNRDKHRRGRLLFRWPNQTRGLRVMDFKYQGRPFDEIPSLDGCSLLDFHHRLLSHAHPDALEHIRENHDWLMTASRISPRYLHYLSLSIVHGLLFDNFIADDPEELRFVKERVMPSFARAVEIFGVKPLIVRLFSPEEEKDSWIWQYPGEHYEKAFEMLRGRKPKSYRG